MSSYIFLCQTEIVLIKILRFLFITMYDKYEIICKLHDVLAEI